ncbi:MAG: butyrate kinase [Anaerovoracaceae bacterium]
MVKDILVINPGSTSTKIAVFRDGTEEFEENISHDPNELLPFAYVADQMDYRRDIIKEVLTKRNYDIKGLSAVVGRGGMIIELKGGGYRVTPKLCKKMASDELPQHASSLGALLAYSIAEPLGVPSYIYDSTMGCEISDVAKITGMAEVEKYGCCHVLNSRAQAMKYAESIGKKYEDTNLIVCHMGGGVTANAQKDGIIIDTATYDDGPMAPERSGGVPLILFKQLCFDGKHTEKDIDELISGKGGLYSYLGTTNCIKIEQRIADGDKKAALVYEAMAYQIAKSIADMSVALKGKVDAIILTGGVANSKLLTGMIREYAGHIGKIVIMAGESEMEALAGGALRMLQGKEIAREY